MQRGDSVLRGVALHIRWCGISFGSLALLARSRELLVSLDNLLENFIGQAASLLVCVAHLDVPTRGGYLYVHGSSYAAQRPMIQ